jgi:hypothetical protein
MASSDKAQYAIEIAAQMTGGTQSVETLDALTDSLLAGGKDADYFKDAITRVSQELESVASSVTLANDALGEGQARYKELEKAADMSAKAAERAALKHGGVVPKELFDAAEKAKAALSGEADSLRKLELAAAAATGKQDKLQQNLKNLNTLSKHTSARLGEAAQKTSKLTGALGDLGGPLGTVGQRVLGPIKGFVELSETFGKSAAMTIAFAAGLAIVSVALIAGAAAVAVYGVSLADQARSAKLSAEAFSATSEEAAASVAVWGQVNQETGVTTDRLRDLTKSLQGAKVSAEDMPAALKAAATAEAALGQGGADEFIAKLKDAKSSVADVASEVEKKFGGVVSRKMLGLEAQGARLQTNIGKTFGGLDIEPLLAGLSTLVDLFDENTASGKALKFVFETLIQPLIDAVVSAIPLVEAFFLGFLIGAMKLYIALQPAFKAIKELLGFDDETGAETFRNFTTAGEIAAYAVVALGVVLAAFAAKAVVSAVIALGTLIASNVAAAASFIATAATAIPAMIAALWAMIAPALIAAAPFLAIAAAVAALGYVIYQWGPQIWQGVKAAFEAIAGGVGQVLSFLAGLHSQVFTIGIQIMQGLAQGIANGAGAVVGAITGAVKGAINAAKSLLGIASPSKLFADIGGFTSEGFALGVEAEAPQAQDAMTAMVTPPEVPNETQLARLTPSGPQSTTTESPLAGMSSPVDRAVAMQEAAPQAPQQPAQGSASVSLSGVTININGVENAEDAAAKFRDLLLQMMNGTLTQAGGTA